MIFEMSPVNLLFLEYFAHASRQDMMWDFMVYTNSAVTSAKDLPIQAAIGGLLMASLYLYPVTLCVHFLRSLDWYIELLDLANLLEMSQLHSILRYFKSSMCKKSQEIHRNP